MNLTKKYPCEKPNIQYIDDLKLLELPCGKCKQCEKANKEFEEFFDIKKPTHIKPTQKQIFDKIGEGFSEVICSHKLTNNNHNTVCTKCGVILINTKEKNYEVSHDTSGAI